MGPLQSPSDAECIERVQSAEGEELQSALQSAYAKFMEHIDAFELDRAEPLIRAMHARVLADWSAVNYSLLLGRADRFAEARSVLSDQMDRATSLEARAELHQIRALSTLGSGRTAEARREMGASLLNGSSDAAIVLGWLAISAGETDRARCLARAQLASDPAPAWALRTFGLSMLPPAGAFPSR